MDTPEHTPNRLQPLLLLLPMLMIAGFMVLGYQQAREFKEAVVDRPQPELDRLFGGAGADSTLSVDQRFALEQWRTLALLEQEVVARRYEQAGLLLVSRILVKYLGLLTGMIMAIAGSIFIIGRIREEATRVSGEWQQAKVAVRSSSPGILFGLMGAALMGLAIVHHQGVTTQDSPLYLHPANTYLIQPTRPVLDEHSMRDLIGAHGGSSEGDPNVIPADSVPEP
ncbi:MAG: hypothetical protein IPJ87_01910 [Flavobacteriales bacterium]|nr:hypothetical protein [Flavobacteriales bacterium]MBK7940628.1 hypothetical protein [Flavobacteriales bacterium]MBK8950369.1 hypothetical protein [Flavobacteriales bacterium]MBK9700950.1 hypothetical protein [Flavobacteriales bacterium]